MDIKIFFLKNYRYWKNSLLNQMLIFHSMDQDFTDRMLTKGRGPVGHMKMKQTSSWNLVGGVEHAYSDRKQSVTAINTVAQCVVTAHSFIQYILGASSARNSLEAERDIASTFRECTVQRKRKTTKWKVTTCTHKGDMPRSEGAQKVIGPASAEAVDKMSSDLKQNYLKQN